MHVNDFNAKKRYNIGALGSTQKSDLRLITDFKKHKTIKSCGRHGMTRNISECEDMLELRK